MKKMILAALFGVVALAGNAQEYYHGVGGQFSYRYSKVSYTRPATEYSAGVDYEGSEFMGLPAIMYKSTLAFDVSRSTYFAVSAYPNFGLQYNTGGNNYIALGLPLVAEYYFNDIDDATFFVGAGMEYSFIKYGDPVWGNSGGKTFGPHLAIGGQFELRDRMYGVRLGYTYGLNKLKADEDVTIRTDKKMLFSLGIYVPLGL